MVQQMSVLGIDIATLVFHMVGMDDPGAVVLRKRIARSELRRFIATLPPLRIGMEACGSAHYWARCCRKHGHDVRLIAPHVVKAYVQSPKHDIRDAEAICAAVTRPPMRFAPIKRLEPQDLQALHRVRARLIKGRTALVNEIRGLLSEYGIVLPQGLTKFRALIVDKRQAGMRSPCAPLPVAQ
jgi:transposase